MSEVLDIEEKRVNTVMTVALVAGLASVALLAVAIKSAEVTSPVPPPPF
jgi:hypothetical protein